MPNPPLTKPPTELKFFRLPPGSNIKYRGVWLNLPEGAMVCGTTEKFDELARPRRGRKPAPFNPKPKKEAP